MGKRLNELKKGIAFEAKRCAGSYEEYHEDTDEMEGLRKKYNSLREKFRKSKDNNAKEKMLKEHNKLKERYYKVRQHREKVKNEFRKFHRSFEKWSKAFGDHIHNRQIKSKWRSEKNTKEAIQLGVQYGQLMTQYDALNESFYN